MYKGIIFDLDGVLCHTDNLHYQAWKAIADELQIPFDQQINQRLRGVSRMESFEIILENYSQDMSQAEKEQYINKKNERYVELLQQLSHNDVDPDVLLTLQALKGQSIKLAIGSSSKNAKLILNKLELSSWFDFIADGIALKHSKPHPEVFLKAAEGLVLAPSDCLVIEDAQAGVQAAFAANMDCAAIGELATKQVATYNIEKLSDLLELV